MNRKMFFRLSTLLLCLWAVSALRAPTPGTNAVSAQDAPAENAGQEDLDKAIELQLTIEQLEDVEKVIALCESAMSKGLDKDNTEFAKQLLVIHLL